jgi:molybdopterin biosynthesis enzyme
LAEDITAKEDLPRFDRSAVDGYALKSEDANGASQFKPLFFQLIDTNLRFGFRWHPAKTCQKKAKTSKKAKQP